MVLGLAMLLLTEPVITYYQGQKLHDVTKSIGTYIDHFDTVKNSVKNEH